MLRIGRYVGFFRTVINRLKELKRCEASPIFKLFADIANTLYMVSDHILLINRIGAYKYSPDFINKLDFISNVFWGIECCCNIIYDIVDYLNAIAELKALNQSLKKLDNNESEGKGNYKIQNINLL